MNSGLHPPSTPCLTCEKNNELDAPQRSPPPLFNPEANSGCCYTVIIRSCGKGQLGSLHSGSKAANQLLKQTKNPKL